MEEIAAVASLAACRRGAPHATARASSTRAARSASPPNGARLVGSVKRAAAAVPACFLRMRPCLEARASTRLRWLQWQVWLRRWQLGRRHQQRRPSRDSAHPLQPRPWGRPRRQQRERPRRRQAGRRPPLRRFRGIVGACSRAISARARASATAARREACTTTGAQRNAASSAPTAKHARGSALYRA